MVVNTLTIPGINKYTGDLEVEKSKLDSIASDLVVNEVQKFLNYIGSKIPPHVYITTDLCDITQDANVTRGSIDFTIYDNPTRKYCRFTLVKSMLGGIANARIDNSAML